MQNWAGNITFGAAHFASPERLPELQALVREAKKLRVLGSGHSFNRIADSDDTLLSLRKLERLVTVDAAARTVTLDGGATYEDVAPVVHRAGFALGAVASLPNITVAGAVSTATHGSGDRNRNLSAAVSAIKLVTPTGEIKSVRRSDPDFAGMVVGLGALGVISELTLDLIPHYDIRQTVYLDLPVAGLLEDFGGAMASAHSISLFTRWQGDHVDQVWVKALDSAGEPAGSFIGARAADMAYHPVPGRNGEECTPQMGRVGAWHERLFHFPIGGVGASGAELQSEYFVAREHAADAFRTLHAVQEQFAPALFIGEVRSVAADELWLSPAYRQDTVGFHFTWKPDWNAVIAAAGVVEAALAPFAPRPHWAKVFPMAPADVRARFPRMSDFIGLAERHDPDGKFRNPFLDTLLRG